MRITWMKRAAMVAMAVTPSVPALGGVILADDFETGNTVDSAPTGWTTVNNTAVASHTINTLAQSPFSGAGSVGVYGRDERTNVAATSITRAFATPETDALTIEFDFRSTSLRVSPSNNNSDYVFQLRGSLNAVGLQVFLADALSGTSASLSVLTPGSPNNSRTVIANINRDQWYRIRIETQATSAIATGLTADITLLQYVSGSEAGSNLVTTTVASQVEVPLLADIDDYASIRFTAADNTATEHPNFQGGKYLDNVVVTSVPEPAALVLLGAGALCVVGKRP